MKRVYLMLVLILFGCQLGITEEKMTGVRGDPDAIAEAIAMVETMGGKTIWFRLKCVHFVHRWDPYYEVRFGKGDIPDTQRLEFYGPDGVLHGWIILNVRKEPIVWATSQYRYIFGPMKRFGNLRVPNWAVYENGITRYEMISLIVFSVFDP